MATTTNAVDVQLTITTTSPDLPSIFHTLTMAETTTIINTTVAATTHGTAGTDRSRDGETSPDTTSPFKQTRDDVEGTEIDFINDKCKLGERLTHVPQKGVRAY